MGLFKDFVEGVASGFFSAAADGRPFAANQDQDVRSVIQIEACCAQLGWGIDERTADGSIVLYFKDPLVNIRKLMATPGDSGHLVLLSVFSAARLPASGIPPDVLGYLLRRNGELALPSWQMFVNSSGQVAFAVAYFAIVQGLDAALFQLLCETMCKEVHDFDRKLRQAGVL